MRSFNCPSTMRPRLVMPSTDELAFLSLAATDDAITLGRRSPSLWSQLLLAYLSIMVSLAAVSPSRCQSAKVL